MSLLEPVQGLTGTVGGQEQQILNNRLLAERLHLYVYARFLVVAAIIVGAIVAKRVVQVEGLDVTGLHGIATVLALYNIAILLMIRPYRNDGSSEHSEQMLAGIMHGAILLDFVVLTIAVWLVGGARSPFLAFYMFNVILASVLLSPPSSYVHTLFAYLLLSCLVLFEWQEWIPTCYAAGAVSGEGKLDGRYVLTLLVVYGMLFALSSTMLTSIMATQQVGERNLHNANAELKRLSEMRRDFLHIALHDLKTPMAAVNTHLTNLEERLRQGKLKEELHWVSLCRVRLEKLSGLVRDLQVLARLGSGEIVEEAEDVDIGELLHKVVADNRYLADTYRHTLKLEVEEGLPPVHGVGRLLQEAVVNFVTNAIKYTQDGGTILVRGLKCGDKLRIEVQDNGIGISSDDQARVFQEFARVRPNQIPEEKASGSSGLGLAIARRIADSHGGSIEVVSELGHGSMFTLILPIKKVVS